MKVAISFFLISSIALFGSIAFGQYAGSARLGPDGNYTITATINNGFPGTPIIVTGRPYSGEEMAETTQILADGTQVTHPRSGENIQGLINISRAEPSMSLFEVPSEYQLVDETGSFTITVTGHK